MNTRGIQKLRQKFILIAMVSFFLAMAFIGTLINVANYFVTQREIDWTLAQIGESRGDIENDESSYRSPDASSVKDVFSPSYQRSAFYIVFYNADGTTDSLIASKGSMATEETVRENAADILSLGKEKGRYYQYYYRITKNDDGTSTLVMLDCGVALYSRLRLAYASLAIGVFGMLITLFPVIGLSKKAVAPEIENSRKQEQFLTNASHELKTPLAVIRSNTEMEEIVSGESEWTQSTIRQVDRMNSLIQNLVMISKSREMEGRTELAKINASEAVAQTARDFASRAETEGKTLLQDIVPDLELTADGSQLRQLTMILLDNAVKYCDANGNIAIRLEPAAKWGKKGIRLTVSNDYAAGKDVDYTRFFDRFYREDKSHNIDTGGYGIGLSIAEHICEQYKGSIRADWRDGKIFFICDLF